MCPVAVASRALQQRTKYAYASGKDFIPRTLLTRSFKAWVEGQDFSAAAESDTAKKPYCRNDLKQTLRIFCVVSRPLMLF